MFERAMYEDFPKEIGHDCSQYLCTEMLLNIYELHILLSCRFLFPFVLVSLVSLEYELLYFSIHHLRVKKFKMGRGLAFGFSPIPFLPSPYGERYRA